MNFKDKLATNMRAAHKMASNWVMGGASTGATVYLMLSPEDQRSLVTGIGDFIHAPAYLVPVGVGLLGLGARLWPQKNITPAEAEAKSAQ